MTSLQVLTQIDPTAISLALGVCIGFVLTLTGAGGAVLSVPLLVFCLQIRMTDAAPIALMAMMLSSGLAAALGLKKGIVRYKAAALLAILGMLFAPIGVSIAHQLPEKMLKIGFAITLLVIAWRAMQQVKAHASLNPTHQTQPLAKREADDPACMVNPATAKLLWTKPCTRRLMLTGALSGLLSGLLGVGGGFIIVPALQSISNLETKVIVSTSLAVVALVSMASAISYAGHGTIAWAIAWPFIGGTLLGMLFARSIHHKISTQHTSILFALLSLCIAIMMLISTLH